MRRLIVSPQEWGTLTGYDFLNEGFDPDADIVVQCHFNWSIASTVQQRSWRIWEPGRMALSNLGVSTPDTEQPYATDMRPQGCKIHGIKGTLTLMPQTSITAFDVVTGDNVDGLVTWSEMFDFENGQTGTAVARCQAWTYAPYFMTMYKGTFNQLESGVTEGGAIDSGPEDDPDTLTGVDITSPTVLESDRQVWWDMFHATTPSRPREEISLIYNSMGVASPNPILRPIRFHHKTVQLNLDRNWIVGPDQVLWLTVEPGLVCTDYTVTVAGSPHAVMYRPHFSASLHLSMLVTLGKSQ